MSSFIIQMARLENHSIDRLEYNFIDRQAMLRLNKEHLNHDYDTDIITFDYSEEAKVSSEIFISIWALEDSSKTFSTSLHDELLRLVFHGLLHCMGYDDKTHEQQQLIKEKENKYIKMFHVKQLNYV